jgi:putative FmdB family regulatory protein
MPLYEYACRRCQKRFESRLKYEQRLEPQTCPACGARETTLCLSTPSLSLGSAQAALAAPSDGCAGGGCTCGRYPATA